MVDFNESTTYHNSNRTLRISRESDVLYGEKVFIMLRNVPESDRKEYLILDYIIRL